MACENCKNKIKELPLVEQEKILFDKRPPLLYPLRIGRVEVKRDETRMLASPAFFKMSLLRIVTETDPVLISYYGHHPDFEENCCIETSPTYELHKGGTWVKKEPKNT
jgi:hypothetical protein